MIRALLLGLALGAAAPARAEIAIVPVTSPGGLHAWLYEDHGIPMIAVEAAFLGGPSLESDGDAGVTVMMSGLLGRGAGDLDAMAFNAARETLGAHVGLSIGDDVLGASATMLSETRDATVELLRLALTEPRYDADEVERSRAASLAAIRAIETDPPSLAYRAFFAEAFPGHPYGRPIQGTLESVAAIGVDDLRAAHDRALTRDRLLVAVVGDIGVEETGAMLDRLFGGLPATGPDQPPFAKSGLAGQTQVIDLDIPQTMVVFGTEGLLIDDPDYLPAMVMDYVLGGAAFGSRLGAELRERRGLTYGVQTMLYPLERGGLYFGTFSSSNARAGEALAVVRDEWRRLAGGGITDAELAAAKQYLTGEYALRFDGNAQIASVLLGLMLAGHGPDYVNVRNGLVEAVTAEDVARVARRLLKPETLTTVAVGRPEGIEGD
jgi:zinc protease